MGTLLRLIVMGSAWLVAAQAVAQAKLYQLSGPGGRRAYTNAAERIPVAERRAAEVDLNGRSLNIELGTELDQRLAAERAALEQTALEQTAPDAAAEDAEPCLPGPAAAISDPDPWGQLFHDYGPLVVCGGLLILFIAYTPAALRRFGAPLWAKTLMMAIPSLALAGLGAYSVMSTNRKIAELSPQPQSCSEPGSVERAPELRALGAHSQSGDELERAIERIDAEGATRAAARGTR